MLHSLFIFYLILVFRVIIISIKHFIETLSCTFVIDDILMHTIYGVSQFLVVSKSTSGILYLYKIIQLK